MNARYDRDAFQKISDRQVVIMYQSVTRRIMDAGLEALGRGDAAEALKIVTASAPRWERLRELVASQAD